MIERPFMVTIQWISAESRGVVWRVAVAAAIAGIFRRAVLQLIANRRWTAITGAGKPWLVNPCFLGFGWNRVLRLPDAAPSCGL